MKMVIKKENNKLLVNAANLKMKPPWIRLLCVHRFTGGARTVFDNKGRKRHVRICIKCGKREYMD